MKNILIFITPKRLATDIPKYYKESFDNLINNYNAKIMICYKKSNNHLLNSEKQDILLKE